MSTNVDQKLKEIIARHSVVRKIEPQDIKEETNLVADFEYDSIMIIQLVVSIETGFGIEFDDVNYEMMSNYSKLKKLVEEKIG